MVKKENKMLVMFLYFLGKEKEKKEVESSKKRGRRGRGRRIVTSGDRE